MNGGIKQRNQLGMKLGMTLCALVCAVAIPAVATADATVVTYVRRNGAPSDGEVFLVDETGHIVSCHTVEGSCQIDGLPGGRYEVYSRVGGQQSASRSVVIPPDGKVSLFVNAA